jgi:hypothetical protein
VHQRRNPCQINSTSHIFRNRQPKYNTPFPFGNSYVDYPPEALSGNPLSLSQSSGLVFAVTLTAFRSRILRPPRAPRPEGSQTLPHPEVKSNLWIPLCGARNLGLGPAGLTFCASEELQVHSKRFCCAELGLTPRPLSLPGDTGCMQRPGGTCLELCRWGAIIRGHLAFV